MCVYISIDIFDQVIKSIDYWLLRLLNNEHAQVSNMLSGLCIQKKKKKKNGSYCCLTTNEPILTYTRYIKYFDTSIAELYDVDTKFTECMLEYIKLHRIVQTMIKQVNIV